MKGGIAAGLALVGGARLIVVKQTETDASPGLGNALETIETQISCKGCECVAENVVVVVAQISCKARE